MGTRIFNQTGTELVIEDCRVLSVRTGRCTPSKPKPKRLPPGRDHLIKSSSLDVVQELQERAGFWVFRFSINDGGVPLRLQLTDFKNEGGKDFECMVFGIGPGGALTRTRLGRTECGIFNETRGMLLVKNYFVNDVRTRAGFNGNLNAELPPRRSGSPKFNFKFSPSAVDWAAGERWEELEFHFSIANSDRDSLKLKISDLKKVNSKKVVFWIGRGGFLTHMILGNTECRIYNKTEKRVLIKNYFINDVTTGAGVDGNFDAEVQPRKRYCLKFSPSNIDWNARTGWEQMQFHFSIDGDETVRLPLDRLIGKKEYVCQIGPAGFAVI